MREKTTAPKNLNDLINELIEAINEEKKAYRFYSYALVNESMKEGLQDVYVNDIQQAQNLVLEKRTEIAKFKKDNPIESKQISKDLEDELNNEEKRSKQEILSYQKAIVAEEDSKGIPCFKWTLFHELYKARKNLIHDLDKARKNLKILEEKNTPPKEKYYWEDMKYSIEKKLPILEEKIKKLREKDPVSTDFFILESELEDERNNLQKRLSIYQQILQYEKKTGQISTIRESLNNNTLNELEMDILDKTKQLETIQRDFERNQTPYTEARLHKAKQELELFKKEHAQVSKHGFLQLPIERELRKLDEKILEKSSHLKKLKQTDTKELKKDIKDAEARIKSINQFKNDCTNPRKTNCINPVSYRAALDEEDMYSGWLRGLKKELKELPIKIKHSEQRLKELTKKRAEAEKNPFILFTEKKIEKKEVNKREQKKHEPMTKQQPSWINYSANNQDRHLVDMMSSSKPQDFNYESILKNLVENKTIQNYKSIDTNNFKVYAQDNTELHFDSAKNQIQSNSFSQASYDTAAQVALAMGSQGFDMSGLIALADTNQHSKIHQDCLYRAFVAGKKLEDKGVKFVFLGLDDERRSKLEEKYHNEQKSIPAESYSPPQLK